MMASCAAQGEAHIAAWASTLNTVISKKHYKANPKQNYQQRLAIYRELIRTNLEEFIVVVFPISRTLITAEIWQKWMDEYIQSSYRESPLFRDIAAGFVDKIVQSSHLQVPLALQELMRWEWLEMAVEVDKEKVAISDSGRSLNPTLRIEAFDHPVHEMAHAGTLLPPKPTVLLVWRTRDHEVKGWCPDEVTLQLLLHLSEAHTTSDCGLAEQIWGTISLTPSLQILVTVLKQKDILL